MNLILAMTLIYYFLLVTALYISFFLAFLLYIILSPPFDNIMSHRNFFSRSSAAATSGSNGSTSNQSTRKVRKTRIAKMVADKAVVIVAVHRCFMCVTVNSLMQRLGVNPKMVEVEEEEKTATLVKLSKIDDGIGGPWELPAVYVGGKLLGGVDKVIEAHLKGELVPMLRAAGV